MPLTFRLAREADFPELKRLIIDSFEPITWFKKVDDRYGPLNGQDWRQRWDARLDRAFETQTLLVGEHNSEIVAYASGTLDSAARLGFIDLLAVDRRLQGKGFGREMLHGMIDYMKRQGMAYVHLECLADNDVGNSLYRSEGFEELARSVHWFIRIP